MSQEDEKLYICMDWGKHVMAAAIRVTCSKCGMAVAMDPRNTDLVQKMDLKIICTRHINMDAEDMNLVGTILGGTVHKLPDSLEIGGRKIDTPWKTWLSRAIKRQRAEDN